MTFITYLFPKYAKQGWATGSKRSLWHFFKDPRYSWKVDLDFPKLWWMYHIFGKFIFILVCHDWATFWVELMLKSQVYFLGRAKLSSIVSHPMTPSNDMKECLDRSIAKNWLVLCRILCHPIIRESRMTVTQVIDFRTHLTVASKQDDL